MTFKKLSAIIRDPRPHPGAMYVALGLAAAACALRARRQISQKEKPCQTI